MPSLIEIPLPLTSLKITFAPLLDASRAVLSVDLSSTTITSATNGSARQNFTTLPIVFSSFNAGIITDIMAFVIFLLYFNNLYLINERAASATAPCKNHEPSNLLYYFHLCLVLIVLCF